MRKQGTSAFAAMVAALAAASATGASLVGLDPGTPVEVAGIIERHECYACHAQTEARIGPSYRMIAARHAARRDVMEEVLAWKIIEGGAGNWGVVPMVANEKVSLEEARAVARWILELDPDG